MNNISAYRSIAVNTLFQFGSRGLSVLLSLVSVGLLTRYLGIEKYGWFTLVFTYVSFFITLADIGYNQTIVREYSRQSKKSSDTYATLFNFKLILVGVSIILALLGLPFFPYDSSLKIAIGLGIIAMAVSNLGSYGTSILQSQLRLDIVAMLDIFVKSITVIFIALFIHAQLNFYFIISAVLIGNLTGLILEAFFIKEWITFKLHLDLNILKKIVKISIPVGMAAFLSLLYFKIDMLMLSAFRKPYEVGIYSLAYKVLENILMLWGLFMASVFPLLSKYYGDSAFSKYRDLLVKTLLLLFMMSVVIIPIGYISSPLIIRILGGDKFFPSIESFKILLLAIPFLFLNNIFYNVILSFGKTKYLVQPLLITLVANVLLNLYAIPRYGYIGASYTTVITELLISFVYLMVLIRYFQTERPYWRVFT